MLLKHPTVPNSTKNVPDDAAEKWLENGWTEIKPAAKTTPAKPKRSKSGS